MDFPLGIERRDPTSGILMLGSKLIRAARQGQSGEIEVRDLGQLHTIQIAKGAIWDVAVNGRAISEVLIGKEGIQRHVKQLFSLPRPHVIFVPLAKVSRSVAAVSVESMVLAGVTQRRDLFKPRLLVERIPVNTLHIDPTRHAIISDLPLSRDEKAFLKQLEIPTPISMILWKRGLIPEHAGVFLVALNLLGVFEGMWEPGDLPRLTAATQLRRKIKAACPDYELLGLDADASQQDVDKAFRKLSLQLHPDRLIGLPEQEAEVARTTFSDASAAYGRLKRSRRSRPVIKRGKPVKRVQQVSRKTDRWIALFAKAQAASRCGESEKARAFALKALAMSPPNKVKAKLLSILKCAA